MQRRAACLAALMLAACSAEPPPLRVMLADEMSRDDTSTEQDWLVEADLAGDARAFFFAQAGLYLAGAEPTPNSKLADVLRAMGRNDLVDPEADADPPNGCPHQWVEPIEMIARAAKTSRIVMIESERHAPAQTAFLEDLVTRLAADGFSTYADDGLTLGPGGAAHPDVLLVSEGLVTRDPALGRLIREVKRNRLTLIDAGVWWASANELASLSPAAQLSRRQSALAVQINRRTFARDPSARVIIHTERASGPAAAESFKAQLVELTGHVPLMVALRDCLPSYSEPAYMPSHGEGARLAADLAFAIPRPEVKEGRVTSGRRQGESVVAVPPAFRAKDQPVLVEARREGDPDLAVPDDRLLLFPGDRLPLILQPGEYRIEAWTKNGPLSEPVPVSVN